MKRPGLVTLLSITLNFFLFFWLVQQYFSDLYFQAYVNTVFVPIYPFIVLTLGVGGGSGLGYFLLKRRRTPDILGARVIKPRTFRPVSTIASPSSQSTTSSSIIAKNMPTGTPPATTASKHTAYSVPSLAKATSPSTARPAAGGTSWSTGSKSFPTPVLRQDTGVKTPPSNSRIEEPRTAFSTQPSVPRPDKTITSSGSRFSTDTTPKAGASTSWHPQDAANASERRSESPSLFQKPGLDTTARQPIPGMGPAQQPSGSQSSTSSQSAVPAVNKWQSPDQRPVPNQWTPPQRTDGPPPPISSKWSPPPSSTSQQPSTQPQSQSSPGMPPRTGTPFPPRPGFPQSQPPPRPFVYQGPRPGEPRPMGAPRPFGPDQNRPPGALGPGQRPPSQQFQRAPPTSSTIGPMPQPWRPQAPPTSSDSQPSLNQQSITTPSEQQPVKTSPPQKTPEETVQPSGVPGNEMDWDTALDTILKTLRKDRGTDKV